jgi:serine/threonine/tyrosine protein kinase RAD53
MSCAALPRTTSNGGSDSGPSSDSKYQDNDNGLWVFLIFLRLLGSGAFGIVNLMQHRISGIFYAVKVVKKRNIDEDNKVRFEINLGMSLESEYVCKVLEYYEDDENFYIIMEYLEGIDLCDFICKNPKFFVENPRFFWFVVKSILQGLAYLHSQGIAHMDIKPENVILSLDMNKNIIGVKLIDLGYAIEVNEKTKYFGGTAAYMAPELFRVCLATWFPADIWSFGMTAYAMLRAYLPIHSTHENPQRAQEEIYAKIKKLLRYPKITPFKQLSEDKEIFKIQNFITSCFIVDPEKRPSAQELLDTCVPQTHQKAQINP